jgi:hypothetical protein
MYEVVNPEIPGLDDFNPGIRDPGIAIPTLHCKQAKGGEKHFSTEFITREDKVTGPDGTVLSMLRKRPRARTIRFLLARRHLPCYA